MSGLACVPSDIMSAMSQVAKSNVSICYQFFGYSQLAIVFPGGGNRKQGNTTVWDSYVYCVLEHLINTV